MAKTRKRSSNAPCPHHCHLANIRHSNAFPDHRCVAERQPTKDARAFRCDERLTVERLVQELDKKFEDGKWTHKRDYYIMRPTDWILVGETFQLAYFYRKRPAMEKKKYQELKAFFMDLAVSSAFFSAAQKVEERRKIIAGMIMALRRIPEDEKKGKAFWKKIEPWIWNVCKAQVLPIHRQAGFVEHLKRCDDFFEDLKRLGVDKPLMDFLVATKRYFPGKSSKRNHLMHIHAPDILDEEENSARSVPVVTDSVGAAEERARGILCWEDEETAHLEPVAKNRSMTTSTSDLEKFVKWCLETEALDPDKNLLTATEDGERICQEGVPSTTDLLEFLLRCAVTASFAEKQGPNPKKSSIDVNENTQRVLAGLVAAMESAGPVVSVAEELVDDTAVTGAFAQFVGNDADNPESLTYEELKRLKVNAMLGVGLIERLKRLTRLVLDYFILFSDSSDDFCRLLRVVVRLRGYTSTMLIMNALRILRFHDTLGNLRGCFNGYLDERCSALHPALQEHMELCVDALEIVEDELCTLGEMFDDPIVQTVELEDIPSE